MTINEKIHTTLSHKEVILIGIALNLYQTKIKEKKITDLNDQEMIDAANKIANRLTDEVYLYPVDNFVKDA